MCLSLCTSFAGFASKQLFCYYQIDFVRERLQETISKIATRQFGAFAGNIIGNQLGILFATTVTVFIGELVGTFVQECIKTIVNLISRFWINKDYSNRSYIKEISTKIVCLISQIFAKSYFCNYGMPFVKIGIELASREILKLSIAPFSYAIFSTAVAVMLAAPVTFLLGDIVSIITSEVAGYLFETSWDFLANNYV